MEIYSWTFKRLMKDVRDITKDPLHDNGIFYCHDDENILKGYALIVGPENTPYAYGFYLFKVDYPSDYPTNPPKFTFLTNADNIRMNPNLYRNGKVCISILNTWRGEAWSSSQTLKTVLLTLLTIFNEKPLLNEPGYTETCDDFKAYNEIITFKNIDVAIMKVMKNEIYSDVCLKFSDQIQKLFLQNYDMVMKFINSKNKKSILVTTKLYTMSVDINYEQLERNMKSLYKTIA